MIITSEKTMPMIVQRISVQVLCSSKIKFELHSIGTSSVKLYETGGPFWKLGEVIYKID